MTVIHGPSGSKDLSYEQAVEETRLDYARLLYEHDLSWLAHPDGRVEVVCCCSEERFPATAPQASHIREAIRAQRGPIKQR